MVVDVKKIMKFIQLEARDDSGVLQCPIFSATEYYTRRMNEYKKQEQLILMGAGSYGKKLCDYLIREGLEKAIICFCDNNNLLQGKNYKQWGVYSPQDAVSKYPEAMFIITPKKYEDEMIRQLVHLGISIDRISTFIGLYCQ